MHALIRAAAKKALRIKTPNSDDDQQRLLPNPKVIFDVGANIGQTAFTYRWLFPKADIFSFEPVSDTFDKLVANTKGKNVHPVNLAFDEKVGKVSMNIGAFDYTNSLLHRDTESGRTIEINTTTVDKFCKQTGVDQIDILKIDVEGAEDRVLRGAKGLLDAGKVKMVFLEVYFNPVYKGMPLFTDLDRQLQSHGFALYGLYSLIRRGVDGRISFGNALYTRA